MATQTPLHHPRENAEKDGLFPYRAQLFQLGVTGDYEVMAQMNDLPADFQSAEGGAAQEFEEEAPTSDRILVNRPMLKVSPEARVLLTKPGYSKRFTVSDVIPAGANTLLTVSQGW